MKNKLCAALDLDVPFHDVDAVGVVWHGNYLKYFELAREVLLRKIGFDYPDMCEAGYVWPVVECRIKYVRPARYAQRIRIEAQLLEYENRLRMEFLITDAATGEKLTKGETTQVAVDMKTKELMFVSPRQLIDKVEKAMHE